jgi:putative ABC transport system permease protein
MLKHNLLFIYRNFKRFKSSFFINLVGLSTGLTSTILIYLWVNDELNFDKFHEKGSRIFQVMEHEKMDSGIKTTGQTTDFLAKTLADEMPEVEYATVVTPPNFFPSFLLSNETHHIKAVGKFVEPDFMNIFSYPLAAGNPDLVLANKNNIVISESLAKKLFSSTNCIGKSIEWQLLYLKRQVFIAGVLKDLPNNSSEHFDFILPFESFNELIGSKGSEINWDNTGPFFTYLVVKEKTDINQLQGKINRFLRDKSKNVKNRVLFLKPFADNYLHGQYENGAEVGGRIEYVRWFLLIAVIILLIACINFMNLSTAKAFRRIKEIGIKRALGAQRKTLIYQYLGEALFMTSFSLLMALLLAKFLLPLFKEITGKNIELLFDIRFALVCTGITLLTTLLAGGYPALYLSGFNPAKVLKGQVATSLGELWTRKGLVIFQFVLSVIFIVSVIVVYKQIEFIQTKSLGYSKDNVIYFETEGKIAEDPRPFISETKNFTGVVNASSMLGNIVSQANSAEGGGMADKLQWEGKEIIMNNTAVNYGLIEVLGIEMKEGRAFASNFNSDKDKIIYNEAAIEAIGIKDPVGKIVGGKEILGVMRNFHYESFHEAVKPSSFRLEPQTATTIMIKIKAGAEESTIRELQKFYKSFNPGFTLDYKFLDQGVQANTWRRAGLLYFQNTLQAWL